MEITKIHRLEGLAPRRKAAGWTQQQLADLIGVPRANLAAWEALTSSARAGILPAIADLLLCTVDDLYRAPAEGAIGIPYEGTRTRAGDFISDAGSPSAEIIPDREAEDHAD